MTPAVLRTIAFDLMQDADKQKPYYQFANSNSNQLVAKITPRWVEYFMVKQNLVIRSHVGKHGVSLGNRTFIRKRVDFHLGMLKRGFESGRFYEKLIEKANENHFICNMDNG